MPASYPVSVKRWSPTDVGFNYPEDLKEIVYARHVTSIYDEVTAMQVELGAGTGGLRKSVTDGAVAFDALTSNKTWDNLRARLNNLEQGVLDSVNRRVRTTGGSTISSSSTTVGLVLQTSGTGDLVQLKNTAGTTITSVNKDGFLSGIIDCGTA